MDDLDLDGLPRLMRYPLMDLATFIEGARALSAQESHPARRAGSRLSVKPNDGMVAVVTANPQAATY